MANFTWNEILDIVSNLGDYVGIGNTIRKLSGDRENKKALNKAEAELKIALDKLRKHNQSKYDQLLMSTPKLKYHMALSTKDRQAVSAKARKLQNENANLENQIEMKLANMVDDKYGDYSDRVKYSNEKRAGRGAEENRRIEHAKQQGLLEEIERRIQ